MPQSKKMCLDPPMLSKSDAFYAKEDERLALVPGDGIIKIHALPGRGSSKVKRGGRGKFDFALFKLIGVKHFKSGARYFINTGDSEPYYEPWNNFENYIKR